MSWLGFIQLLLQIVLKIMDHMDDKEQQRIGEDRAVKRALAKIVERTQRAHDIDDESRTWSDADIDDRLRDYWRDNPPDK